MPRGSQRQHRTLRVRAGSSVQRCSAVSVQRWLGEVRSCWDGWTHGRLTGDRNRRGHCSDRSEPASVSERAEQILPGRGLRDRGDLGAHIESGRPASPWQPPGRSRRHRSTTKTSARRRAERDRAGPARFPRFGPPSCRQLPWPALLAAMPMAVLLRRLGRVGLLTGDGSPCRALGGAGRWSVPYNACPTGG